MRNGFAGCFLVWAGFAALTAIWGCVQFAGKIREAHALGLSLFNRGFYDFYVGERIKGFTSHWNTFSAGKVRPHHARGVPAVRARAAKLDLAQGRVACF